MLDKSRVLVLVPAFNEAGSVARTIRELVELELDVLVIDDGSTDETVSLIKGFKRKIQDKRILYLGPQKGFASHFFLLTQHI
jgi:glycosyltransferase involved in cell wall biosynthesis